jgi:hypothetical protein
MSKSDPKFTKKGLKVPLSVKNRYKNLKNGMKSPNDVKKLQKLIKIGSRDRRLV